MKVWGVIFLVCSIDCANAKIIETEEDGYGSSIVNPEKSQESKKGEASSSVVRENNVNFVVSSSEDEEEPSAFFLSSDEESSPPGGGLPLDKKFLDAIAPLPDVETPWWEHWWGLLSGWFSSGKS